MRLTSKFLTSQPEKQTITIHILLDFSRCKDNQTREIFLFKNCAGNDVGRLVPDPLPSFEKALYKVKVLQVVCSLVSLYFDSPQLGTQ